MEQGEGTQDFSPVFLWLDSARVAVPRPKREESETCPLP